MTGQTSTGDVIACVSLAIGVFGTSLIPFFLLVEAEHLTPAWLRDRARWERALLVLLQLRDRVRLAAVDTLLGLLLLTAAPKKGASS